MTILRCVSIVFIISGKRSHLKMYDITFKQQKDEKNNIATLEIVIFVF